MLLLLICKVNVRNEMGQENKKVLHRRNVFEQLKTKWKKN